MAVDRADWAECNQADEAACKFHRILIDIVDVFAPFIELKIRANAPKGINGDYLAHINEHEYYARRHKQCPCDLHLEFKQESKIRTKQLKTELQQNYFEDSE